MSARLLTAYHEAAHVLAARFLGRSVESVSLAFASGVVQQEPLKPDATDEEIKHGLVVVLAGSAAERYAPAGPAPEQNGGDPWFTESELAAMDAVDGQAERPSDEDVIEHYRARIGDEAIEDARDFAAEIVERMYRSGRLESLADEILFRGHLTGDDIERLLGAPA